MTDLRMSEAARNLKILVARHAANGVTLTGISRIEMPRASTPTELLPEICQPLVSLILQGEKRLMVGSEMLHYAAG